MPSTKRNDLMTLLVRKPTVCAVTSTGSSTIDLWISQGKFPKALPLGDGGVKIWSSSSIRRWIRDHAGEEVCTDTAESQRYSDDQLLGLKAVSTETTLCESTIRLWVKQGRFPPPIRAISPTKVLWRYGTLKAWANDLEGHMSAPIGGETDEH